MVIDISFTESLYGYAPFTCRPSCGLMKNFSFFDDIIITGDDVSFIIALKKHLQQRFEVRDLGPLCYFLGLKVAYSFGGYLVSQQKYTLELLACACLIDDHTADTLMELNQKLYPTNRVPLSDLTRYR